MSTDTTENGCEKNQKLLYILNIAPRINNFSHASMLASQETDMEFHIAGHWSYASSKERLADEERHGIKIHQIDFIRTPYHPGNINAYLQLKALVEKEKYDVIHCNTPIGGMLGRLAGKKCKVKKVIYQAHGFHFYKGAPLLNWLLYYPVEKWLARYTDALITINQEDYALAKRKMKLRNGGKVYYVPGVGVDIHRFSNAAINKGAKRRELGIPEDAVLLLSVGELNHNKNHETVIRAIADMNVHYIIAGQGELQQHLETLIDELNLRDRVKLLGFRSDVKELYEAADIFVFPSFREGLSVAVMEAMASGLPCVASKIRGNTDLLGSGEGGFLCNPHNASVFAEKINLLAADAALREQMGSANLVAIRKFSTETVIRQMQDIYAAELLTPFKQCEMR